MKENYCNVHLCYPVRGLFCQISGIEKGPVMACFVVLEIFDDHPRIM